MNVRISNDSLTAELIRIWIDVGNTALLWFDILAWVAIIVGAALVIKWSFNLYKMFSDENKEKSLSAIEALLKKIFPSRTNKP